MTLVGDLLIQLTNELICYDGVSWYHYSIDFGTEPSINFERTIISILNFGSRADGNNKIHAISITNTVKITESVMESS